jgi:hypothetical protein
MKIAGIITAAVIAMMSVALLSIDYVNTRSAASFALVLNELPPGTPFEEIEKRFGKPSQHFTEPDLMTEWGPLRDQELIKQTDLYYFFYRSIPYRYICVYRDKTTGRVSRVTWKPM